MVALLAALSVLFVPIFSDKLPAQNDGQNVPEAEVQPGDGADLEQPEDLEEQQSSGPDLPPKWKPPARRPPEMDIEKELLTPADAKDLRDRMLINRFIPLVNNGQLDAQTRPLLQDGVKYHVYLMTLKDQRRQLHERRADLIRHVRNAARLQNNSVLKRQFRDFLLGEIVNRATDLLDGNYYVRLNAVILLTELDLVEADPRQGTPPVAYTPAYEPLLQAVNSETQPLPIKLVAINGLKRIASYGELIPNQKIRIGESLIRELEKRDVHWWYPMALCDALGSLDQLLDLQRKPFIIDALFKVMIDKERHAIVRSEAAKALGRAQIDAQINLSRIVYEFVHLAVQFVEAHQKEPDQFYWSRCFWNLYLAFRPEDAEERLRDAGLLIKSQNATFRQHQNMVRDAYEQVVPLFQKFLNTDVPVEFNDTEIQKLKRWLQNNQPANMQLYAGMPPVSTTEEAERGQATVR